MKSGENYFLYLIDPVDHGASQEKLDAIGLGHLPPSGTLITRGMMSGPDHRRCTMIADGRCKPDRMNWRPKEQTWKQAENKKFWIGFWNDRKPTEADLRRESMLDGYDIQLGDGGKWRIPIARLYPAGTCLEQTMILSDGVCKYEVIEKHLQFSRRVEALWDDFQIQAGWKEGDYKLEDPQRYELAAEALKLNYFAGIDEVNMLRLLTTRTIRKALAAILDVPHMEEIARTLSGQDKKKQEDAAVESEPSECGSAEN